MLYSDQGHPSVHPKADWSPKALSIEHPIGF
jgi:hypothetical protein